MQEARRQIAKQNLFSQRWERLLAGLDEGRRGRERGAAAVAELERGVGRYHCPGEEQGWRPASPPVVSPGVPPISRRLARALPLSLSFLRPLTASPSTFLGKDHPTPPPTSPLWFYLSLPLFPKTLQLWRAPERLPFRSRPQIVAAAAITTCPWAAPGAATAEIVALPSLFGDDHLRLVPVKFQPKGPVAQVHLRFAGHEPGLRGGELVEWSSLVGVAVLLWVGVAGRGVALR